LAKRATLDDFKNRLDLINSDIFKLLSNKKSSFSFRVNRHKSSQKEAIKRLLDEGFEAIKVKEIDNAYTLPYSDRKKITKSSVYSENLIYIQSLSSIFAAQSLGVNSSDWVLDLAAV